MRTQIHFTHMDRSESLEAAAQEKFESLVEEFLNREDCHLQVWLVSEKSHRERGRPEFRCEVSLRFPPKKELFASKSSDEMYDALNATAKAIEQQIRAHSKKEIKQSHKGAEVEIPPAMDTAVDE